MQGDLVGFFFGRRETHLETKMYETTTKCKELGGSVSVNYCYKELNFTCNSVRGSAFGDRKDWPKFCVTVCVGQF